MPAAAAPLPGSGVVHVQRCGTDAQHRPGELELIGRQHRFKCREALQRRTFARGGRVAELNR